MRILAKAVKIYILGICTEGCKKHFDSKVDKYIRRGKSLADTRLTKMSNRCSRLYSLFREKERELNYLIDIKNAVKNR